jgi:hypothetical protein
MEAHWSDEQQGKGGAMVRYPGGRHVRAGLRSKATPIACLQGKRPGRDVQHLGLGLRPTAQELAENTRDRPLLRTTKDPVRCSDSGSLRNTCIQWWQRHRRLSWKTLCDISAARDGAVYSDRRPALLEERRASTSALEDALHHSQQY